MTSPSTVYVSVSPDALGDVAGVADGVEVKLDWKHAAELSAGKTLTDRCREQGVSPEAVVSVHLPPGTSQRYGMSVAPGNAGPIADFVHTALGTAVRPEWLTVHTARRFEFRDHVERLARIPNLTGYPIAVENTPDRSQFHSPEALALFAWVADGVDRLEDVHLLVDTAHVDSERRTFAVDERALARVSDWADAELSDHLADEFRTVLTQNVAAIDASLPRDDPWRPVLTTLYATGGDRVRAVHLNDPVDDGLPPVGHRAPDGLQSTLAYCRKHRVPLVLEPGDADRSDIRDVVEWLRDDE